MSLARYNTSNYSSLLSNESVSSGQAKNTTVTWSVLTFFSIVTCISGIITNGTLLYFLISSRTLRTSFNIYLINLFIANLICVSVLYPMDFLSNLHSSTWVLSNTACSAYLYVICVVEAGIYHSHLLIGMNRIWAVVHPMSYRSIHSARTACLICLSMWIYIHLVAAPEMILDTLYYRQPVASYGCFINVGVLGTYDFLAEILFFNLPHLVIVLAWPIVYVAKVRRERKHLLLIRKNAVEPVHTPGSGIPNSRTVRPELTNAPATVPAIPIRIRKQKSHGFFLLTLLTVSVIICWTPIDVYYLLRNQNDSFNVPLYLQMGEILFSLQTTLDPVIFAYATNHLRISGLFTSRSMIASN
ncbi:hypothetical protein BV898_00453 [Hypsibius exemplaris]|uniref:G-protein coupled receptors family 1 profile domain-containing protein n=1 Tax=Hypsibius exemplaris TaxID=2072580 RepID=A0A1W0XDH2_HYPEX|nr:hypothetical protein BV898_00453 [Hypsibius exemplaris]